jgi:hypothetical protein
VPRFRSEVLAELARHGVRPQPHSRPEVIREFVNDLYRLELQRLRNRVLRRELARSELAAHVVALRRRYRLLSTPVREWIEKD